MNEKDTKISSNIRLINLISKRFTTNRRFASDELPICRAKQDIMQRSTVSFFSSSYIREFFLSFNHLLNFIFPCSLLFLTIYTLHAGYLCVTDTLSTPSNMEPPSEECQDLLIPTRSNACVARIDLSLTSHPND